MNEFLWFAMLIANFLLILFIYRFVGKTGLFLWIPIATIIANIQVVKMIDVFGVQATLGNIVYASSFLVTDILSENYGKRYAKKSIYFGFFTMVVFTLMMNLSLLFIPSVDDFADSAMHTIFEIMPRIALASMCAYAISQLHDIRAYEFWKRKLPATKYLWVRNNLSTMISQALDTIVFTAVAFIGVYPLPVLIQICVTSYLIKWLVAALDTPFLYIAKHFKTHDLVKEID